MPRKSDEVAMVEVKGPHLDGSDSQAKAELGRIWADNAGLKFKYFMVFLKDGDAVHYANRSRTSTTNALSFQVVVPVNGGNVHFLYKDIVGSDMNGRNADIGVQMIGGRWARAYTYSQQD